MLSTIMKAQIVMSASPKTNWGSLEEELPSPNTVTVI